MKETIGLYDRVIREATMIILMVDELEDTKEQERRLGVCKANAGICYNAKRDLCTSCTCYMESKTTMLKHRNPKAKGRIEITHCPLAKWGLDLGELEYATEKEIANYYRKIDGKSLLT